MKDKLIEKKLFLITTEEINTTIHALFNLTVRFNCLVTELFFSQNRRNSYFLCKRNFV